MKLKLNYIVIKINGDYYDSNMCDKIKINIYGDN